jgi:hypothetical protein
VGYADEVYVAVPWLQVWNGRRRGTSNLAVRTALEVVQIGVIECKSGKFGTESKVEYHIPKAWPAVVPRYKKALDSMLRPEVQEFQAAAGTSGGTFWTPFKGTCKKLLDLLENYPDGVSVREAVDKIEHHYASDNSARGAIPNLAKRGAIPGIALEHRGRIPYLKRK